MGLHGQLMMRSHVERRYSNLGLTQSRISPSTLQYTKMNEEVFGGWNYNWKAVSPETPSPNHQAYSW